MNATAAVLAAAIWSARQAGRTLDADATLGTPDLASAYAIQRALLALRTAAGETGVGWKLGYTSAVMRHQMGINQPNFGPLTDAMLLASDDAVAHHLVQPRVEPEIGLRLHTALDARHAPLDRQAVAAAVGEAFACLEVVHSTWTGYRFNLAQNTADNASAGQVVIGPRLPVTDWLALGAVAVSLCDAHRTLGQGLGSHADGHPLDAVARLAGELARIDRRLEPGDIVITGGLTAAHPLAPGDRLVARFSVADSSVEVAVRRSSDGARGQPPAGD